MESHTYMQATQILHADTVPILIQLISTHTCAHKVMHTGKNIFYIMNVTEHERMVWCNLKIFSSMFFKKNLFVKWMYFSADIYICYAICMCCIHILLRYSILKRLFVRAEPSEN